MLAFLWIFRLLSVVFALWGGANAMLAYSQHVAVQNGSVSAPIPADLWDMLVTVFPLLAAALSGFSWWPMIKSGFELLSKWQADSPAPLSGPQSQAGGISRMAVLQAINTLSQAVPHVRDGQVDDFTCSWRADGKEHCIEWSVAPAKGPQNEIG